MCVSMSEFPYTGAVRIKNLSIPSKLHMHGSVCISTYCSPAFWPQSRSEGSVGSAGPWEEEAEEPQTLEQQHPEKRRESSRKTESDGGGGQGE